MTRAPARRAPPLSHVLRAAASVVAEVLLGRTPEDPLARLDPALRPAAQDLAYTALRDFGRGDFFLARLMTKPLKSPAARALLITALARLERRPEEAHTLVDQAVEAAAKPYKGLANAVLRGFLRRREALQAAAEADPVAHWRHPRWWLDKLAATYPDDWPAIAAAGNAHPPMCLRLNRRRPAVGGGPADGRPTDGGGPATGRPSVGGGPADGRPASADFAGLPGRWLAEEAFLLDRPLPVLRLPGFREGQVSVQDWGAQQAARLLDAQDGMRVLDACAAPGNKTAHLLERAELDLVALELDAARAKRIEDNLARLGLAAQVRVGDARRPADWWDGRPYQRILADVPCSASGVARRHPDIKWLRRPEDVAGFTRTQAEIVDALWPLLAPGGKMLYATCSVFAEENDAQVSAFVARHVDARRLPTGGAGDALQLLPSPTHDGFFYALLEKAPR